MTKLEKFDEILVIFAVIFKQRKKIPKIFSKAYKEYFNLTLYVNKWSPNYSCSVCYTSLLKWSSGSQEHPSFAVPMLWKEPTIDGDCYFCMSKTMGVNKKKQKNCDYPHNSTSHLPVPHSQLFPVPESKHQPEEKIPNVFEGNIQDVDYVPQELDPMKKIDQGILNDIGRKFKLSKRSFEQGASFLKQYNMLGSDVKISYYRKNHEEYQQYFTNRSDGISFCCNIVGLLKHVGFPANPVEAR